MIDAILGIELELWNLVLGVVVTIATLISVIPKAKTVLYKCCFKKINKIVKHKIADRKNKRISTNFKELTPMIDAHVELSLAEHRELLRDQSITLQSSISETVEFKSFAITNMISLQNSIEKLVLVVQQTAEDSQRVRECLDRLDRGSCPATKEHSHE
ncbi:MAG: hypothetical protein KAH32_03005 [Chlamydiia bacterium]|nr:hypothetical protein [Chlamydiia bacterium]